MIRLLLDQGLPRSAVGHLREAGWDAEYAYDVGLARATDQRILAYARAEGRICVTLDADFHALLALADAASPSVIRIREEGLSALQLANLLISIWPEIEKQVLNGAAVSVSGGRIRVRRLPILR